MANSKLYLLPNFLGDNKYPFFPDISKLVNSLNGLIAESEKMARRYLLNFVSREKLDDIPIFLLNEHSLKEDIEKLCLKIKNYGLISDAGIPCLADPGAELVSICRKKNIEVEAILGPSSIILALMLSGFSGQKFCFVGYLPRKLEELKKSIINYEKNTKFLGAQIFIEAPYRSDKLLNILLSTLKKDTHLCVAKDLTMPTQKVISKKVKNWKAETLGKSPCVFLIK